MAEQNSHASHFVIEWRDGFTIHIPQIDREHKQLFSLVKKLDPTTADRTIDELLDYVATHFTHEQELMEASGYPAFEEHLRLHEQFGATVADFLGATEGWTDARVHELRRFLNKWLIGHILTHDLRFGNWYRDRHSDRPATTAPVATGTRKSRPKVGWFDRLLGRS